MTIVAGAVVGILGVAGWGGFLAYLVSQALVRSEQHAAAPGHLVGWIIGDRHAVYCCVPTAGMSQQLAHLR